METERTSEKKKDQLLWASQAEFLSSFFSRWYVQSPSAPNKLTGVRSSEVKVIIRGRKYLEYFLFVIGF